MIAGHYRLVERIGSGGTGVVWRAIDERLERSVAVKQILTQPSLPAGEKDIVRQRAAREARNAARFQHPNAIVVFDITDHNGDPCLVMEYLPSQSLAVVLSSQGTLPLPQVARIGEQVASALVAAHRAGIVHRDVKPGNVLLGDNGTVKITDFGISKAKGDVALTATGLISGTAAYLAPEVARGAEPSPAADVFALGATLFHALEGEPPYGTNPNPLALLYAAANGQLSQPRNAGPLTDLLLDLLSFDPEDRPSMTDIRDHLAEFVDEAEAEAEPTRMLATHRSGAPRRQSTRTLDRRAAQADISTAEMMASAAPVSEPGLPPVRPAAAYGPATRSNPITTPDSEPSGGRRRTLVIGGVAALVIAVAAVLVVVLSTSNSGSSGAAAKPSAASVTASAGVTTTASGPAVGQTPVVGKTDVAASIQVVVDFYNQLSQSSFASAWKQLTPAAQHVYGSQQAFQEYWTQNSVTGFNTVDTPDQRAAADGSVTVNVASVTSGSSSRSATLRLVNAGGKTPLIDSDTQ